MSLFTSTSSVDMSGPDWFSCERSRDSTSPLASLTLKELNTIQVNIRNQQILDVDGMSFYSTLLQKAGTEESGRKRFWSEDGCFQENLGLPTSKSIQRLANFVLFESPPDEAHLAVSWLIRVSAILSYRL